MRYKNEFLKGNETILKKICQRPECSNEYYVSARYSEQSRYCSGSCLQKAAYAKRKEVQNLLLNDIASGNETDINNSKINDMDSLERLLELNNQLNEAKTKLLLQERDMQDLNRIKAELFETNSKLELFKESSENLEGEVETLSAANADLEAENGKLLDNWQGAVLANLIMRSKGLSDFEGKTIKYADIAANIKDFKHPKNSDFEMDIWDFWKLVHKKDSEVLQIINLKKS